MKVKGVIDRIENGIAVVETDGGFVNVKVSDIKVSEGDTVEIENSIIVNAGKTDKSEIKSMLNKLFE